MPWFYVDDAFSDSKPIQNLPDHIVKVPMRIAASGLWLLAGCWSAKELLDGYVPAAKLRQLGGTEAVIQALVDPGPMRAPLCEPDEFHQQYCSDKRCLEKPESGPILARFRPKSDPIRVRNWPVWQDTKADVLARRKKEAEKKRGQRIRGRIASTSDDTKMSPGDTPGDSPEDAVTTHTDTANPVPRGLPGDSRARVPLPIPIEVTHQRTNVALGGGSGGGTVAQSAPPTRNRKPARTQIPDDWQPPAATRSRMREQYPHLDLSAERQAFIDHHQAHGNDMADWSKAFWTWLRNTRKFGSNGPVNGSRPPGQPSKVDRKVNGWLTQGTQGGVEPLALGTGTEDLR